MTRTLLEVDEGFRESADRGYGLSNKVHFFGKPICAVKAFNLSSEAKDDGQEATLAVLNLERDCERFMEWQQGSTPREHIDMQLLNEQRTWQAGQEELANERHRANLKAVADATKWNWWGVLLAAALGAAATLGGVWISRGPG